MQKYICIYGSNPTTPYEIRTSLKKDRPMSRPIPKKIRVVGTLAFWGRVCLPHDPIRAQIKP